MKNSMFKNISFIIVSILLNSLFGLVTNKMGLPFYFDSVFTIVAIFTIGLAPGLLIAILTNLLLSILNIVPFPFVACHISTAIITFFMSKNKKLTLTTAIWIGTIIAFSNGVIGSYIALFVFNGITKYHGIDKIVMGLIITGQNLTTSVFWAGMLTNLIDKLLSIGFSVGILLYLKKIKLYSVPVQIS